MPEHIRVRHHPGEALDTCLPSIAQIEAELGRIREEESGTLGEKC